MTVVIYFFSCAWHAVDGIFFSFVQSQAGGIPVSSNFDKLSQSGASLRFIFMLETKSETANHMKLKARNKHKFVFFSLQKIN